MFPLLSQSPRHLGLPNIDDWGEGREKGGELASLSQSAEPLPSYVSLAMGLSPLSLTHGEETADISDYGFQSPLSRHRLKG